MQLARIWNPAKRTYFNKIIEILRAIQIEIIYSKTEILEIPEIGNETCPSFNISDTFFSLKINFLSSSTVCIQCSFVSQLQKVHATKILCFAEFNLIQVRVKGSHVSLISRNFQFSYSVY